MNDITQLRKSLKKSLSQKTSIILCSLDSQSHQHLQNIEHFLPKLKEMESQSYEEFNQISKRSNELKKQFDNLYQQKNVIINKKEILEKKLDEYHKTFIFQESELKKGEGDLEANRSTLSGYEDELSQKKSKLKQAWIPFYGLAIYKTLERIETKEIPELKYKISKCNYEIQCLEKRIKNQEESINQLKEDNDQCLKNISELNMKLNDLDNKIKDNRMEISGAIQNLTYLSILKNKINIVITQGSTNVQFMKLLDLDPEVIHYEDQVYLDLLTQWNISHDENMIKQFILKAESDYFS